eukprot:scaffold64_cov150-Amphora_coffeaeformis.AAC.6
MPSLNGFKITVIPDPTASQSQIFGQGMKVAKLVSPNNHGRPRETMTFVRLLCRFTSTPQAVPLCNTIAEAAQTHSHISEGKREKKTNPRDLEYCDGELDVTLGRESHGQQ